MNAIYRLSEIASTKKLSTYPALLNLILISLIGPNLANFLWISRSVIFGGKSDR